MTQKEFEERTGLKLSADGYTEVEECYMNTDLDKDAFCKLWMENPTALKEIERKTVLVRELYEERKCLTNLLIDQAEKWSASDLREKAIAMIGEKEYLRRKIAKGYNLWDADKKLLDEILRKKDMAINFRKLKSQIKPFKPEVKDGYIFITTDEQKNNGLFSIAKCGSKRGLLSALSEYIKDDEDFKREFTI